METVQFKIIYQEANPYGSLTAFLEDDGRTIYLYLQSEQDPEWKMKSVWIKNRICAPDKRNEEDFQSGLAPLLCKDEIEAYSDIEPIKEEDVYFIWTEEGDGVALFIKDKLTAFIPPWSDVKGFHGYSINALKESITAHPLGNSEDGAIHKKVQQSRDYWEFRSMQGSWKEIQSLRLNYLESKLGNHSKYWSADGGKYPQLGIAQFEPKQYPGIVIYSTIGMSAQNMPSVELYHKDYLDYARIEIVIAIKKTNPGRSENWVPHFLGDIIKYPWMMCRWFGEGHTMSLTRRDPDAILNLTNVIFLSRLHAYIVNGESLEPPELTGLVSENNAKVKFLFIQPLTDEETMILRQDGAKEIFRLMEANGLGWIYDPERSELI